MTQGRRRRPPVALPLPRPLPPWRRVQSGVLLALLLGVVGLAVGLAVAGACAFVWVKAGA